MSPLDPFSRIIDSGPPFTTVQFMNFSESGSPKVELICANVSKPYQAATEITITGYSPSRLLHSAILL